MALPPMMVAQTVNVLYSLVDRIYIGHLESASAMALTGIGLSMPIICIVGAFARICGAAAGPLCSIARGKGDIEDALDSPETEIVKGGKKYKAAFKIVEIYESVKRFFKK